MSCSEPDGGSAGALPPTIVNSSASDRPRFEFLDGLRGVASQVVGYDIVLLAGDKLTALAPWIGWTRHGVCSGSLLIVLSGYWLTLPVVQHGFQLKDGFKGFVALHARRILPLY